MSAVQFARQRGIPYTTFIQWRTKARSRGEVPVTFTEVEMILHVAAKPLVVELGPLARLQLTSPDQLELAAGLLKHLHASC